MSLLKLDVSGVRNIQSATLLPSPTLNFITGCNASGKSSLLEAIFILGRARSYRTAHIKQAINFEQSQLVISGQKLSQASSVNTIGIQIDTKSCQIRIDQENRQKADLAHALPVQLIHPKSYRLLDSGSQIRREFLDWGVFNQEGHFLSNWRMFNRALQQRNALLKTRQLRELAAWDKEFVEFGVEVNQYRNRYIAQLQPVLLEMAGYFLELDQLELRFFAGWDEKRDLADVLASDRERDVRYGFTHSGPHRGDLLLYHNNRLARDFLSRGQQKLLVLALMLSQVSLLQKDSANRCCILIDDLSAELDTVNRSKLLKYLTELGCQVFLTSTELADFGDLHEIENYKVFHVERGCVNQL